MNARYIVNTLGRISVIFSLFALSNIACVYYYDEFQLLVPLLISALVPLVAGGFAMIYSAGGRSVDLRDRYLIVVLSWVVIGFYGALPYYLTGGIPRWVDALFESVSGFSTTGASILTDIEALPTTLLYWRALSHWLGGMGIIVLVIAVFPKFRTSGYQMFSLEASSLLNQKLKPHTADIAKRLWAIYLGLTVVVFALLVAGEMPLFESLCHAFSTVATGGFSPKNSSIAGYSPFIQYTLAGAMLLSGMNFTLHYSLITGNLRRIAQNSELKAYLGLIAVATAAVFAVLRFDAGLGTEFSFRQAFFHVCSIITTTGFAASDYLQWPAGGWMVLLLLMFVGGCVGSTSGGLKVIRFVVIFKYLRKQLQQMAHPKAVKVIKVNQRAISDARAITVVSLVLFFLVITACATLFMTFLGLDITSALSSVLATLGAVGPGLGSVGPVANYAHIPDVGKVLLFTLMIVGRLEIMTFMVLFTRGFWGKRQVT